MNIDDDLQEISIEKHSYLNETHIYKAAYNYFQYHAKQRTDMFNYFVFIYGALWTALITTMVQDTALMYLVSIAISIFQLFTVFIFYKIDRRNKYLVESGEKVLINFEKRLYANPKTGEIENDKYNFALFNFEKSEYDELKKTENKSIPFRLISFSNCVKCFYYICLGFSSIGAIVSIGAFSVCIYRILIG